MLLSNATKIFTAAATLRVLPGLWSWPWKTAAKADSRSHLQVLQHAFVVVGAVLARDAIMLRRHGGSCHAAAACATIAARSTASTAGQAIMSGGRGGQLSAMMELNEISCIIARPVSG